MKSSDLALLGLNPAPRTPSSPCAPKKRERKLRDPISDILGFFQHMCVFFNIFSSRGVRVRRLLVSHWLADCLRSSESMTACPRVAKKKRATRRGERAWREGGEWGARRPREPAVGPILRYPKIRMRIPATMALNPRKPMHNTMIFQNANLNRSPNTETKGATNTLEPRPSRGVEPVSSEQRSDV